MICIHAENVTINYCDSSTKTSCGDEAEVVVTDDCDDKETKPKES